MTDTIKITSLSPMGTTIPGASLTPVVDMSGEPTTKKATVANLANAILSQAGNGYAYAAKANLANIAGQATTVTQASQPNITSVGTLTSLTVSGETVLGPVGNVVITGGANGYFLKTDGTGNLSWSAAGNGGSGTPAGNNQSVQFNNDGDFGGDNIFTYDTGTGRLTVPQIRSNGSANFFGAASVNLGTVGNLRIAGGANGQVLGTDGAGNLRWLSSSSSGNGEPGGANTQVQFNDDGSFGGSSGLTFDKDTGNLAVSGIVITEHVQSPDNSNVIITVGTPGPDFRFTVGGALEIPGGHLLQSNEDDAFELRSATGLVISTDVANANVHFTFATDGQIYCPANANFEGTRLNVGPGAANVPLATNPTLVVTDSGLEFIQAALLNANPNGSSDYAAYGADSDETQAFTDIGIAGHTFNDPNYTITNPGDGYLFTQGYANGIGGSLVLATGENGNIPDIVFATGGYLSNNEFARIDHANDVFHLTRAGSGIKFPDGSIQTTAGGGGGSGAALVNGDNSFVLNSNGNVVFEGDVAGQGVNRGLVWDYGANADGVNSEVRQDNNGLTVRAWTEDGGGANGYSASVNIVTNQDANLKQWVFDGSGNLTLAGNLRIPSGNIESDFLAPAFNSAITGITTGNATVIVTIVNDPFDGPQQGQVTISDVTGTTEANGIWYYEAVNGDQFELYTDGTYTTPVDGTSWTTYISGGTAVSTGVYSNLTIQGGNVLIKNNDQTWNFSANGALSIPNDIISNSTIDIDNRATSNSADINLYSADDILLQARDRSAGSGSEGGDINIYAGDSAEDGDSSGGDVVIEGGNGGASNTDFGGSGGFIRLQSGRGGDASTITGGQSANDGGALTLRAGDSGSNMGNVSRGAQGGDVYIESGDSTDSGQAGGGIFLTTGAGGPSGQGGIVRIDIPSGDTGSGGIWTFDGTGNLTLPANTFAVNYANGTQVVIGDVALGNVTFDNQIVIGTGDEFGSGGLYLAPGAAEIGNLQYLRVRGGDQPSHIHFDTGNNLFYDQYFGNDNKYVKLEAGYTGNVVIGTDDDNGNLYRWTFDSEGQTTVPGNIKSITTGFAFTSNISNIQIVGTDVIVDIADSTFGGPFTGQVTISGVVGMTEANGTWYFQAVEANQFQLFYGPNATFPVDGTGWPAYVSGGLAVAPGYNNLSITGGNVSIINNDGDAWSFNSDGSTIYPTMTVTRGDRTGTLTGQTLLFGDSTQSVIISTPNGTANINDSQRLIINPGAGYADTPGEGGDIYLYAGRGGSGSGSGGDIKIRGGLGPVDGYGGYIDISGGEAAGNGPGGYIEIFGGQSANFLGGEVRIQGGQGGTNGANANISGGAGANGTGGNVNIAGGTSSNGILGYGNINIVSGASTWTFDNTGSFVFPGAGVTMDGQNNSLLTSGLANVTIGTFVQGADGGISWEYQGDGANANTSYGAVGLDTAGTANTANLRFKVQLVADQGNVSTNKEWIFDTSGNLTLPGNTFSVNYANGTQVSLGGGSYGNSNVATFLASYGSNSISTTGNVVAGLGRFSGTFDESEASTAGMFMGYAGGTPRIMFATGNTSQTLEIDNDGGTLRFYKPGTTLANLNTSGDFATLGNITATGKIGYANGGTATQTGTGQGVTLNQLTGQITLAKSSWNAGDTEVFNISCNKIANTDYVMAQVINGSEASYFNTVAYPFTPVANSIRVQVTAVVASTSTPVVQFLIMKAATT